MHTASVATQSRPDGSRAMALPRGLRLAIERTPSHVEMLVRAIRFNSSWLKNSLSPEKLETTESTASTAARAVRRAIGHRHQVAGERDDFVALRRIGRHPTV